MAMLERVGALPCAMPTDVNHIMPRDCRLIVAAAGGTSSGIVLAQPIAA